MKKIRVSVAGKPNVGKSTLLNRFLGEKLFAVSSKPQTTQDTILGILTEGDTQIVFLDNPGIFRENRRMKNRNISKKAWHGIDGSDLILFISDGTKGVSSSDSVLLEHVLNKKVPLVYVINKSDKMTTEQKFEHAKSIGNIDGVMNVFSLSAEKGKGCAELLDYIKSLAKDGAWEYQEEELTDRNDEFLVAEFIREKIFRFLGQELPYSTKVEVDNLEEKDGHLEIFSSIIIERESQKKIILGKDGTILRKIIRYSSIEIENLFKMPVKLRIFVKKA